MVFTYPACFFRGEKGYSVVFPDLNWLATEGKSKSDAMNMAVECLAGYLSDLREGDQLPVPSDMNDIDIGKIAKELVIGTDGVFVMMVSVDAEKYAKEHFR